MSWSAIRTLVPTRGAGLVRAGQSGGGGGAGGGRLLLPSDERPMFVPIVTAAERAPSEKPRGRGSIEIAIVGAVVHAEPGVDLGWLTDAHHDGTKMGGLSGVYAGLKGYGDFRRISGELEQ